MARLTDVHCHLLPPELRRPPAPSWQDPWFAACHADSARFAGGADVVASLDQAGLDRAVVFGWPFADPGLLAEVNDYVAGEAAGSGDRLLGMAMINPARAGWERELGRCRGLGMVGVGELNADAQGFGLEYQGELRRALAALSEMGWPLMLHSSEPVGHLYPGKGSAGPKLLWALLAPALAELPELRVCLAHLGGGLPFYAHMPEVADLCRQLWFDTAAVPYLYQPQGLAAVEALVGADRICFASDFPLLVPGRYQEVLAALTPEGRAGLHGTGPSGWLGDSALG